MKTDEKFGVVVGGGLAVDGVSETIGSCIANRLLDNNHIQKCIVVDPNAVQKRAGIINYQTTFPSDKVFREIVKITGRNIKVVVISTATYEPNNDPLAIEEVMIGNLHPYMWTISKFCPYIDDAGHIICISSRAAFYPSNTQTGYSMAKAALNTFVKAQQWGLFSSFGVHIHAICPGYIVIHNSVQGMEAEKRKALYQIVEATGGLRYPKDVADHAEQALHHRVGNSPIIEMDGGSI